LALICACWTTICASTVIDARLRRRHLRLGLGERVAVIAVVDARDHLAGGDMLVVGDRDFREIAGHLGGDRELARRNEGVVRRLVMAGVVRVEIAAARHRCEQQRRERGAQGPPALVPARLILSERLSLPLRLA